MSIYNFKGPCDVNEVFFPSPNVDFPKGVGGCFRVAPEAQVTYEEVDRVCLDSSGQGSKRYPFNKQDPEHDLLMGHVNFGIDKSKAVR